MTPDQVLGTWKVVSFKATTGDQVGFPLGEHPTGFIGFTANRFWVMLVDSDRERPAAAAVTDAESVALMKSSAAYTGNYKIDPMAAPDGNKITIQPSGNSWKKPSGWTGQGFFPASTDALKRSTGGSITHEV